MMDDDVKFNSELSAEIANLLAKRCLDAGKGPRVAIEIAVSVAAVIAINNHCVELFEEELRAVRVRVAASTEKQRPN